jgi:hypothetical protein
MIANFMRWVKPTRIYTKKELLEHITRIQDVTVYKTAGRSGNGMIMKHIGGDKYKMYDELVTAHRRYFVRMKNSTE